MTRKRRSPRLRRVVGAVTAGVAVLAVAQQLARPRAERTWNGRVAGVPYDFRPPTLERVRRRLWAPEDPHLLVPRVLGVGWTVNLARVVRVLGT
jgi:uncharacterized protein DUF5808